MNDPALVTTIEDALTTLTTVACVGVVALVNVPAALDPPSAIVRAAIVSLAVKLALTQHTTNDVEDDAVTTLAVARLVAPVMMSFAAKVPLEVVMVNVLSPVTTSPAAKDPLVVVIANVFAESSKSPSRYSAPTVVSTFVSVTMPLSA